MNAYRFLPLLLFLAACSGAKHSRQSGSVKDEYGNSYRYRIYPGAARSKPDGAVLSGRITLLSPQAIPGAGATVTIRQGSQYTQADHEGRYYAGLEAGTYHLQASSVGYYRKEIPELTLRKGDSLVVDVSLMVKVEPLE